MAKKSKQSTTEIQRLLDEKRRVEQWLARLDMTSDKTPADVRTRVRGDYQGRLDAVVKELGGYKEDLTQALNEHRQQRRGLARDEEDASARLAEAELRHTVGEYNEGQWAAVRSQILEELVKIREELKGVDGEVASLEELLAAFEAPADEEPEVEAPKGKGRGAEPEEEEEELEEIEEEEPAGRTSGQTDAFDELAFLKSVTEVVVPPKSSGGVKADKRRPEDREARGGAEPSRGKPQKGTAEKNVKCGECGALNLPTEWYCERCGAELTAV